MSKTSSHYISQVIECCETAGIDRNILLTAVPGGAPGLANPMRRHDSKVLLDVYAKGAEFLNDPSIGLLAGSHFNSSVLNQTGKLLPLCETFGQAIRMLQRYHKLTQSFAVSVLAEKGDEAAIVWKLADGDFEKYKQATEAFFTGITAGARWMLWNIDQSISYVSFRHACPTTPDRYEQILGCPVLFGQDRDALVFEKPLLLMELPGSNPGGLKDLCRSLDRLLIQVEEDDAIVDRVCASIRDQLHDGAPDFDRTAQDVGVSFANLRYRLKLQQTTFRTLVEKVRQDICQYELSRGRKMYIIAQQLGFHDQAAFNRAFKKWYGLAPKEYAREIAGA